LKSVVSITVPQSREDVFAFLDVLSNHVQFTDHFLVDWSFSGPDAGVGAKARLRAKGQPGWMEMEVISSEAPRTNVEETVSAGGKRRTRGTYVLEETPEGGTNIVFEFEFVQPTTLDRLIAPLALAIVRRGNARAMERLKETLARRDASVASS
jgi:Polyketide cyclase / dehydrase and lipid transport